MKSKWSSIRHAKWFIPIAILMVSVLVAGGVFAFAAVISNLWTSPTITVTQYVPPPPGNSPLVISSPDFTTPRSISTGEATLASVTLNNPSPSGAPGYTGVRVQFTINKTGIAVGDVVLEYQAGGTWYVLTLVDNGDVLTGVFGPSGGFPVPSGYNETTPLRATFNTVGIYYATAQAIQ